MVKYTEGTSDKATVAEQLEKAARHSAFLKRTMPGTSASWRQRKMHRTSAAKILRMLDNQAVVSVVVV